MALAREVPPDLVVNLCASLALTALELHPSTEPAVIAAQQRAEVAACRAADPRATPEDIAAELVLPVWSVEVRLAELDGSPIPHRSARTMPDDVSPFKALRLAK